MVPRPPGVGGLSLGRFVFLGYFVFDFTEQLLGGINHILDLLGVFVADVHPHDE
jgi:hypothetical protein